LLECGGRPGFAVGVMLSSDRKIVRICRVSLFPTPVDKHDNNKKGSNNDDTTTPPVEEADVTCVLAVLRNFSPPFLVDIKEDSHVFFLMGSLEKTETR